MCIVCLFVCHSPPHISVCYPTHIVLICIMKTFITVGNSTTLLQYKYSGSSFGFIWFTVLVYRRCKTKSWLMWVTLILSMNLKGFKNRSVISYLCRQMKALSGTRRPLIMDKLITLFLTFLHSTTPLPFLCFCYIASLYYCHI